ncbi:MAG: pilus assembly protein [Paracoccaceae bacterium]
MKLFANFAKNESGAVTVDWVVLTAAIVGIAILVLTLISGGINTAAQGINTELQNAGTIPLAPAS